MNKNKKKKKEKEQGKENAKQSKSPVWDTAKARRAFGAALKKSVTDYKYREKLLASSRSAKQAITAESGEPVPAEVKVRFYPREELDYMFVVLIPAFNPLEPNPNPDIDDHVRCTWPLY